MDNRLALLSYAGLTPLLMLPAVDLASRIRKRLELPQALLFAIVLLVIGVAAEATFFMTMVSTGGTKVVVWLAAIVGTVMTILKLRDPIRRKELCNIDSWAPFAVMYAVGVAFIALLAVSLTQGDSSVLFAEGWPLRLPNDNILPHLLAQHIAEHAPAKPFVGEWLSSDRPPLQAGFDLLFATLTPFAVDVDGRYQALSMVLQAAALAMLFTLCRINACSGLRSGIVALLATTTGFAFVNTVFVWPKLLAAAFVLVAIAIYLAPGSATRSRAVTIGAGVGLGLMTHGGVVFVVPALVAVVVLQRRRHAIQALGFALCVVGILNAPWAWYQKVYDPPGDRLLKWHLAGQIAVTDVGFGQTLYHAYVNVPIATIARNKIDNIETLFGTTLGELSQRGREFFYVGNALGVLGYPFVIALFFLRSKRRTLRSAAQFAWIAVVSLLLWALVLYLPNASVVHVGSNATMLLMFLASGIVATEWVPILVIFFTWQLFHFSTVWLTVVDISNARTPGGAVAVLAFTTVIGACCAAAVKPAARRLSSTNAAFQSLRMGVLPDGVLSVRPTFRLYLIKALICAAFVAPVLIGLFMILRTPVYITRATVVPAAVRILPRLSTLALRSGHAVVSLDAVTINGVSTIVAGLKAPRTFHVSPKDAVVLTGWAFDPEGMEPADEVEVRVNERTVLAIYGSSRPDVAAVYKEADLIPVGFSSIVSALTLRSGTNPVSLVIISHDRQAYYVNSTLVVFEKSK